MYISRVVLYDNYSQYIQSPLLSTILTSATPLAPIPLPLRATHMAHPSSSANMALYRRPICNLFIYFYLKRSNELENITFLRSTLCPDQAQDHHLSSSTFLLCGPVKLYLVITTFHFQLEIIKSFYGSLRPLISVSLPRQ